MMGKLILQLKSCFCVGRCRFLWSSKSTKVLVAAIVILDLCSPFIAVKTYAFESRLIGYKSWSIVLILSPSGESQIFDPIIIFHSVNMIDFHLAGIAIKEAPDDTVPLVTDSINPNPVITILL